MKRRKLTEKQLKEKIVAIKSSMSYERRSIKRADLSLRDLQILLEYYIKELQEKHSIPSSRKFGEKYTE